ncbi:hypothetical protein FACS189425_05200 [Clostridia bacterium]|nr:hypothetical protein FACS189425_05200 [Clostridia bacterium]
MQTLTRNALNEIIREQTYSPDAMIPFLRTREHFMSVPVGIKRELAKLGYDTNSDGAALLGNFKLVLKKAGWGQSEYKNAKRWLIDGSLPSANPVYNYPIRLCFAFGLSGQDSLDFLRKVCLVNGFNFRRADDVVYLYCLENGRSYEEANAIIAQYKEATADLTYSTDDYTKRTQTLRTIFGNLSGLSEQDFLVKLIVNKKNFLAYSVTAHEEVLKLSGTLRAFIRADIAEYNRDIQYAELSGYAFKGNDVSLYNELVYAFDIINSAGKDSDTPFGGIMRRFPQSEYLGKMLTNSAAATDKEHDTARKVFVLLYFANYALDPPPGKFFGDFTIALDTELERCGYAKLYPANPFDWHILNCIRSLDYSDQDEDLNPVELFNDVLMLLAEEE